MSSYQPGKDALFGDEVDDVDSEVESYVARLTRRELSYSRTKLRNAINRDSAASEKRAKNMAQALLQGNRHAINRINDKPTDAMLSAVSKLSSNVLNSLNMTPVVYANSSETVSNGVSCWTDYKDIHLELDTSKFDVKDLESMSLLVALVKGLIYHEGGHILFTSPLQAMCNVVCCGNNHSLIDSVVIETNKHLISDEKYAELMGSESNGYELAVMMGNLFSRMAWNVLEDQRMETAMVSVSPIMAKYFTSIVDKYLMDPSRRPNELGQINAEEWPWIIGRTYLPRSLRQESRNRAEQNKFAHIIPDMEKIVMRYRRSNDHREMHECIVEMSGYLALWTLGKGAYLDAVIPKTPNSVNAQTKTRPANPIPVPAVDDYELEKFEGSSGTGGKSDKDDKASGNSRMETDTASSNDDGGSTDNKKRESEDRSAGDGDTDKSSTDSTDDSGVSQIVTMNEVTEFVGMINDLMRMSAMPDPSIQPMESKHVKVSKDVTNGMLNVLDKLIVQVDPSWRFYQENGVIDPTAFITREPGDTDYWSGMDGIGSNGHDLAVSLLVDSSGSMDGDISQVSAISIGIKKACENYDIPCTITTFNQRVYMVADGESESDYVTVSAGGGTHIMEALQMLAEQRYDKSYHLVIILTDGEWTDVNDVRPWGDPRRHIMIVGLNVSANVISNKGANSSITIHKPEELAPLVTTALSGYFI